MEKKDFTRRYAQQTHSTTAEAADQIDRIVDGLLRRMRAGQQVSLPGLGTLLPTEQPRSRGDQLKAKPSSGTVRKGGSR